jgi:hypothetical protein
MERINIYGATIGIMDDDKALRDIDVSGTLAPASPAQREQYYRLMREEYLQRVPVDPMPGDLNDPPVCGLTPKGRQRLSQAK